MTLHHAIRTQNLPQLLRLLAAGTRINTFDRNGDRPIHLAASTNNLEILTALLQHGANPNAQPRDPYLDPPLNIAAHSASPGFIQILLNHGANINAVSTFGTPIVHAMYGNNFPIIPLLLNAGADPNIPDDHGDSPLHLAASFNQFEIVQLLVAHGANVNAINNEGRQPLDDPLSSGHYDITHFLQQHEATWTTDPSTQPKWQRRQLAHNFLRSKHQRSPRP